MDSSGWKVAVRTTKLGLVSLALKAVGFDCLNAQVKEALVTLSFFSTF
jgi:hypothetical protein